MNYLLGLILVATGMQTQAAQTLVCKDSRAQMQISIYDVDEEPNMKLIKVSATIQLLKAQNELANYEGYLPAYVSNEGDVYAQGILSTPPRPEQPDAEVRFGIQGSIAKGNLLSIYSDDKQIEAGFGLHLSCE